LNQWFASNGTLVNAYNDANGGLLFGLYAAGDLVFTGGTDKIMRMYNVTSRTLVREYRDHTATITAITVYGDLVFSGDELPVRI
jgi:hypothetical protein